MSLDTLFFSLCLDFRSRHDREEDHEPKENKVESLLAKLHEKHADTLPDYKLRAWANMLAVGTHHSTEVPPKGQYFRQQAPPQPPKGTRHSADGKITATLTAIAVTRRLSEKQASPCYRKERIEELRELTELRASGAVTDEEFDEVKAVILREMRQKQLDMN